MTDLVTSGSPLYIIPGGISSHTGEGAQTCISNEV